MAVELSEIADRVAIQDLMYRYAMAVDGRDWTLYRSGVHRRRGDRLRRFGRNPGGPGDDGQVAG